MGFLISSIVIAILLIAFVLRYKEFVKTDKGSKYRYRKKGFFLTRAEHECYDALVDAVGDDYYIFAQVHLPTLLDSKIIGQNWKGAFSHISQKSVDFVLCDKAYIAPKLAIELDDKSHEWPGRKDRDREVERILNEAGVRLLRLDNHGHFDPKDISRRIDDALGLIS